MKKLSKISSLILFLSYFILSCSGQKTTELKIINPVKLTKASKIVKNENLTVKNWKEVIQLAKTENLKPDQRVEKTEEQWQEILSPNQFQVLRNQATERAFSSSLCTLFEPGIYACSACKTELFDATQKFDSGTGWPSFNQPLKNNIISYKLDDSFGAERIEAVCSTCDSHLGHVFPDGPKPSGLRFCMNALALEKVKEDEKVKEMKEDFKTAIIGGGCFWCTEAMFKELKGVEQVSPGYTGGHKENPTYKEICTGNTGHAEVIWIKYNPEVISYEVLLNLHMASHDPTQLNRQGNDVGTQYRSSIFPANQQEIEIANQVVNKFKAESEQEIFTTIEPLKKFYEAEDYHKNYFEDNSRQPYCSAVVAPKLAKFRSKFGKYLK